MTSFDAWSGATLSSAGQLHELPLSAPPLSSSVGLVRGRSHYPSPRIRVQIGVDAFQKPGTN